MPWKECNIVEERLRFIARLLDGEKMSGLCREFGIARKTGFRLPAYQPIQVLWCVHAQELLATCGRSVMKHQKIQ